MSEPLIVRALERRCAAEVIGLDPKGIPDAATAEALGEVFERHLVVALRGLDLDKEAQLAFTRVFGRLDVHANVNAGADLPQVHTVSNLDETGQPRASRLASTDWHSDKSYRLIPSALTFLHAIELPPDGTSTSFADTATAFEALPADEQASLAPLKVVHCWSSHLARSTGLPVDPNERRQWPPVAHPLVRRQPDGRRALFIGQHASHILGMPKDAGGVLLARLQDHVTQDRFIYRHRWRAGDMLVWNNAALVHRAEADFDGDRWPRVLHRTVTRGTAAPT